MERPRDESRKPLVERIPSPSVASPSDLRPRDPNELRWYVPTWGETARLMGWRWLYFLPAALLIVGLALLPTKFAWVVTNLLLAGWQIVFILVALPTGLAINAARQAIRQRDEPFCIHCGYDLTGLPEGHACPECGETFTFHAIEEYRRDPAWFVQRFRMHASLPAKDEPFSARTSRRPRSRDGT